MRILFVFLFVFLANIQNGLSFSLDPVILKLIFIIFLLQSKAASTELEEFIKNDFTISLRHIRPRRKFRIALEALFMVDFPMARHKLSFYLDRQNKRITVDIQSNTKLYSKHLDALEIDEVSTIRSLAILFQPNSLTLYINCKEASKQEIDVNLSKLFANMEDPSVKMFRERKYPLHIDNSVENAMARANCHKPEKKKLMRKNLSEKVSKQKSKLYETGNIF
uniref:CSON009470 protein n=1 Tax=Culicoides sonorensis TaxID=179676 RepID=A0A336N149_CULSO